MLNWFAGWRSGPIIVGENLIKLFTSFLLMSLLFSADNFSVTGRVQSIQGEGLKKAKLYIFDSEGDEVKGTRSKKDGEFIFKKIEPGDYSLYGEHKKEGIGERTFTVVDSDLNLILTLVIEDESRDEPESSETVEAPKKEIKPKKVVSLPKQRPKPSKAQLKFEETFFEYEINLKALKSEIDSLKSVVKGYQKNHSMPTISRELLDLIQVPIFEHRIELQNGTVVSGNILEESDSTLVLETQIGELVLKKDMVVRMDKFEKPAANVIFLGEPFIDYYPNYQIFSGRIKNVGEIRADFVRVISNLFDQTTTNAGTDSIFVKGSRVVYDTNVVADTALEPGQTADYELSVSIRKGQKVQYHTMDVHWDQTQ